MTALRERILPLRTRAVVRNDWLKQRLDTLLPALMAREGFDMWIIAAREYNEDPVIMTMLPEPSMAARRRTILVFSRRADGSVERLTLDRYGFGEFYTKGWDPESEEQDACLARVVKERDPKVIGLNYSATFAFGDGLTHQEHTRIAAALGKKYMDRTTSAERLCVGWLEQRIPAELGVYPSIVAIGHAIIAEAYSSRTIQPGSTTTEDVVWWMRQTMLDAGLHAWFQPSITIQAPDERWDNIQRTDDRRILIQPGDLLHCDMGFYYLGLATDQQQNAYILKPGETERRRGWWRRSPPGIACKTSSCGRWSPAIPATRCCARRWRTRATRGWSRASTPTRSATTATPPGRPSASGTGKMACRATAITRSTTAPATRSS